MLVRLPPSLEERAMLSTAQRSRVDEYVARWQRGPPLPAFFGFLSPCAIAQGGGLGATGSLGQWALRSLPCEAIGQPSLSDASPLYPIYPF